MGLGVYLADATFENIAPAHIEEAGQLRVVAARHVAYQVFFAVVIVLKTFLIHQWIVVMSKIFHVLLRSFVAIDDSDGFGVVAVVCFAYQMKFCPDFQFVPHFVGIVIHASGHVAVHVIEFLFFHDVLLFLLFDGTKLP